jgi:hypothetical protein
VKVQNVAKSWGLGHAWDDHVHEIHSLLSGDTHLVECGAEQVGVAMLQLAPEGAEVTCRSCAQWRASCEKWRQDAIVFRETQFEVARLRSELEAALAQIAAVAR